MNKTKLEVVRLANEDVIATSAIAIDHTKYDHYKVNGVDVIDNYETGIIYRWSSNESKFVSYFTFSTQYSIDIPNAVQNAFYMNVNGTWVKCNESSHPGCD